MNTPPPIPVRIPRRQYQYEYPAANTNTNTRRQYQYEYPPISGHGALWGYSEAIPNGKPFRVEGNSELKVIPSAWAIFSRSIGAVLNSRRILMSTQFALKPREPAISAARTWTRIWSTCCIGKTMFFDPSATAGRPKVRQSRAPGPNNLRLTARGGVRLALHILSLTARGVR